MEGGETCFGAGLQNADRVDVPIHISEEELRINLEYITSALVVVNVYNTQNLNI